MLIVLFFVILLALKFFAIGLVYIGGPFAAIAFIIACYLIARRIEPTAAKPE